MKIHPLIIALRDYKKIEGSMSRLDTFFEIKLSKNITGFKNYWMGLIEDPLSWTYNTGNPAQDMMYHVLRPKEHKPEVIKQFEDSIDELISRQLKELIDSVEKGDRLARLLRFSIDYEPQNDLRYVLHNIPELMIGSFPFKTQAYIYINDMAIQDGVVLSGDIGNVIYQGHGASKATIDSHGNLCMVDLNK